MVTILGITKWLQNGYNLETKIYIIMTAGNTLPSRWHVRPGSAEFSCMSIHFVCIKKMTTPYCSSHRWMVFVAVLPSSGLFLSATPRCWSTFIFRTTGLRAVEDFIRGVLLTLVGLTLTSSASWALLPIPHFTALVVLALDCLPLWSE